jgi:site-specific recombinase XerC
MQAPGRLVRAGNRGCVPPVAGRGRRAPSAGLADRLTPHVLRHFCASQLYLGGMDLVAIQETLGHAWVATTMNYIHVHATHVEDAWIAGQQRAADRLKGFLP